MPISWIDLALLVLVGGFTLSGLWAGFVQTAANLIGTLVGIALAGQFVDPVMAFIQRTDGVTRVIVYLVLYVLISGAVGVIFWMLRKSFGFLKHIPLVGPINHLLGAILGLFEGLIAVGAAIFVALQFLPASAVTDTIQSSIVATWLLALMQIFKYLLPQAMQLLQK